MPRTSKLTDLQLILLTTAAQRPDSSLLPPPTSITEAGSRTRKAVASLLKRGLAEEVPIRGAANAWRSDGEDHIGVIISEAGQNALGLAPADPPLKPASAEDGSAVDVQSEPPTTEKDDTSPTEQPRPETPAASPSTPREGSKQAVVVRLLQQPDGASLTDLVDATGWLPHTTRAALTGLRKRGHAIVSDKASGTTRYRIQAAA